MASNLILSIVAGNILQYSSSIPEKLTVNTCLVDIECNHQKNLPLKQQSKYQQSNRRSQQCCLNAVLVDKIKRKTSHREKKIKCRS